MSTAEIKEMKHLIIKEIQQVDDEYILKAIEKILDIDVSLNVEEYNKDLDSSMKQYKSGQVKTQEQIEIESKNW